MTKTAIFSGFLGAGKTTLIKKLIKETFKDEKIVLIENEFGEIGIDGGFLKEAGIMVTEMNSGCICCSLVGDFGKALKEVTEKYSPDRIIIEPSGVGKLSDVVDAVSNVATEANLQLTSAVAVVDAKKAKIYISNFGEFFNNQIENATTIVLSRTQLLTEKKLEDCIKLIREYNKDAEIITTPWEELDGKIILDAIEKKNDMEAELLQEAKKQHEHHHHHDGECDCGEHEDHYHDGECGCGEHEHHHHNGECGCGEHEHHHHDDECGCGEHEHHHDGECGCGEHEHHHHDGECSCGEHDHHHHNHEGHHHADEVFTSWGQETTNKYSENEIKDILEKLSADECEYGIVLRAKGIVAATEGEWIHFDLVPGEYEVRRGSADYTGRLCVIGTEIDTDGLEKLFRI